MAITSHFFIPGTAQSGVALILCEGVFRRPLLPFDHSCDMEYALPAMSGRPLTSAEVQCIQAVVHLCGIQRWIKGSTHAVKSNF